MLDFRHIVLEDKQRYERFLMADNGRGCEFSFANLYLWGRQKIADVDGHIVMFSQFDRRSVYPFPLGVGDKKAVLDAIIADSKERGIPCRITGLRAVDSQLIEELYPNMFRFHCDAASFDYVYSIDDLADLQGKKYHRKRNHLKHFYDAYPDYTAVPISDDNIEAVKAMVDGWYEEKIAQNPDGDYHMERAALDSAFKHYEALGMDGLALMGGGEVLAMTMGSRLSNDTVDVHFEKARADVDGAYPAINREFARYIRSKYPEVRFLDREEDMGLEGLRRAKQSYYPHHMVEKCWACLLEDGYDY